MTIGFSDGSQQDSWSDYYLGSYHKELPESVKPDEPVIDRDHHVPLLASALRDKDGNMYGMAVDHRAGLSKEDEALLHYHEDTELKYMNDLIKGGMKPSEAYTVAHPVATQVETARSIANWGQGGHEDYQQRTRDAASRAKEPSDRSRHPDAHTTQFGLDESEGAYKVSMAGEGDEPNLLMGTPGEPPKQTVEGEIHDKELRSSIPFAMTRSLVGKTPVLPAANENTPAVERMWSDFNKGDKGLSSLSKPEVKKLEQEMSSPSRYDKAIQQSQDVKSRRESFKIVPPEGIQTTTIDQLRDWFKPK